MKNTMLNEAIYTVLTTKYKKQAREAFKRVQDAGYEVYKNNGHFHIYNASTGKTIYIEEEKHSYGRLKDGSYGYITYREAYLGNGCYQHYNSNMDLVAVLDTPYNKVWNEMVHERCYSKAFGKKSKAVELYNQKIASKRRYMKSCDDSIEQYKKEIEKLQKRIALEEARKADYAVDIAKARAEMGLV